MGYGDPPRSSLVGLLLWFTTVQGGMHASIAGMVAGLLVAARSPDRGAVEGAASGFTAFRQSPLPDVGRVARRRLDRAISVNERLQEVLHPWTSYVVVPLFAFANAGVDLRGGVLGDALTSRLSLGRVRWRWSWASRSASRGPPRSACGAAWAGCPRALRADTCSAAPPCPASASPSRCSSRTSPSTTSGSARRRRSGVLLALVLATAAGSLAFWAGARFRHEGDADLPRYLDRPVDPDVDHIRGPVDAPLTLVEYGDFECPFCARATGAARELRARFGDELRYVFRHLPLCDVHPRAEIAAHAAVAADRQGRFWEMHDLLFAHQDRLDVEDLIGYAGRLELDVDVFLDDLHSREVDDRVRSDVASAEASGARGTPTFFIGERRHSGPYDAETLAVELTSIGRPADTGER